MNKIFICKWCKQKFKGWKFQKRQYCSNKCSALGRTQENRFKLICQNCNKYFITKKYRNTKYCSRQCWLKAISLNSTIIKCIICGKNKKYSNSEFKRGNPKYCSKKCQGIALSIQYKGKNNPAYLDGLSAQRAIERDQQRATIKYKNLIRNAFIRDKNKCQICRVKRKRKTNGKGKNNNLTIHHIKSWKNFPLERYNLNNVITICKKCHLILHSNKVSG